MEPIILASASPRRQEILNQLNIPFKVIPSNDEESYPDDIEHVKIPEYLAIQKVKSVQKTFSKDLETFWILSADTLILFEDKIFGKPKSQDEAELFLRTLQGNTHTVVTGIALYNGKERSICTRTSVNKVTFANMSEYEIECYINSGDWHGVAGGYRIQGLASCFIKKIEGSTSSIMGLPIFELYDMLKEQNYSFL
jgi:septum formation protein